MSAHKPLEGAGGEAFGVGALSVPERFDGFIHEQYGELLRFLRRRTNGSQEAEDVAQESLLKLLRYRESAPISDWRPRPCSASVPFAAQGVHRALPRHA